MPLLLRERYLPIERIGARVNSSTFFVRDLQSAVEKRYVIKLMTTKHILNSEQITSVREEFRQKAKILKTIGNQHLQIQSICDYFELDVADPDPLQVNADRVELFLYLVEEYINGPTLAEELTQRGAFAEADAIGVLRQMLSILQFIHEHEYRVIHADICPENIVCDCEGRLHLTNFSTIKRAIAEVTQDVAQLMPMVAEVTTRGAIKVVTSWIAPPEQQAGQSLVPASDLYSLATTVLRLLTHQNLLTLFDPQTQTWHWRAYAHVSDRLAYVLDKMLQPTVSKRFQSAAEVIIALNSEIPVVLSNQFVSDLPDALADELSTLEPTRDPHQLNRTSKTKRRRKLHLTRRSENVCQSRLNLLVSQAKELADLLAHRSGVQSGVDRSNSPRPLTEHVSSKINSQTDSQEIHLESLSSIVRSETNPHQRVSLSLRQAMLLGSGGWLSAALLASFLGTVLASGLWLLLLSGVIFGFLAKHQSVPEKTRLLMIAIASAGLTLLLVPKNIRFFNIVQILPQLLLLTLLSGLLALILIQLSQSINNSMTKK
jgi:serine/threonine protein kinase